MSERWEFLDELVANAQALAGDSKIRAQNFTEIAKRCERRDAVESQLPLTDPRHPHGFTSDREGRGYTVYWGGYGYHIDLNDIRSPIDLLRVLTHLCGKHWPGFNSRHIRAFIASVSNELEWDLHHGSIFKSRATDNDEERARLTPQLRYSILKRDGFRCRACGSGAAQGAILHIDHKLAIANGGCTERENLQTLCSMCNLGKGRSR